MSGNMEIPLLHRLPAAQAGVGTKRVWAEELKALSTLASPICVQQTAQQTFVIASQVFFGSLGPAELAAAAVGLTVRQSHEAASSARSHILPSQSLPC